MSEITIKVGSVTNAQKGKRVLNTHGYSCTVRRSLRIKRGEGCGYTLEVKGERNEVLKLLRQADVRVISVE